MPGLLMAPASSSPPDSSASARTQKKQHVQIFASSRPRATTAPPPGVFYSSCVRFFRLFLSLISIVVFTLHSTHDAHTGQPTARGDDGLAERFLAPVVAAQRLPGRHARHAVAARRESRARLLRRLRAKGEWSAKRKSIVHLLTMEWMGNEISMICLPICQLIRREECRCFFFVNVISII